MYYSTYAHTTTTATTTTARMAITATAAAHQCCCNSGRHRAEGCVCHSCAVQLRSVWLDDSICRSVVADRSQASIRYVTHKIICGVFFSSCVCFLFFCGCGISFSRFYDVLIYARIIMSPKKQLIDCLTLTCSTWKKIEGILKMRPPVHAKRS